MLQDRILIVDDDGQRVRAARAISAPANAISRSLTLDAPLGRLWKGLRAKFTGTLQRTRVEDPISGQPRKWSGFFPDWQWDLNVRRDAGTFSYGFELNDNQRFTFYRTDEFDTNFNRGAYMTAFVEYRPTAADRDHLDVDNAARHPCGARPAAVLPQPRQPDVDLNEFRDRNRHRSFRITLKQSFGGAADQGRAKDK